MCFEGFQDGCGPALTSAATGGRRRCSSARRPQKQRSPPLVVGMRWQHSLMERAAATQPLVLAFDAIPDSSQANMSLPRATMVFSGLCMDCLLFLLHTVCNKSKYECFFPNEMLSFSPCSVCSCTAWLGLVGIGKLRSRLNYLSSSTLKQTLQEL